MRGVYQYELQWICYGRQFVWTEVSTFLTQSRVLPGRCVAGDHDHTSPEVKQTGKEKKERENKKKRREDERRY